MTSDTSKPSLPHAGFYNAGQLQPENSVGYLMRKVMSSIRTQADAQLSSHELTYAQWLPLFKLSLNETATVASLARDLETDPASMTRSLDRMEAKGLVVRERSTVDRRVVQLKLTAEGQRIAALVPPVLADVLNGHLSDFSHDEWQLLLSMLRRMLVNGKPPVPPSAPPSP
ncbi:MULTISPECIES: MarR family winged helix-turn-helix transcriptional regulator [Acidovorax]|uniref:MarR family winged helix-turn-helix transcriptional regulator n=1 Tax=Acidovorax TaxID=12916 RepID=UPI0002375B92|nr:MULTISPECIES: MarR family winged helix-turn-helix transcriptional regulator [Acidovorax]KRD25129.1 MarR family transcriptional regulator [Acidovorax sp. Root267]KRD55812.1 MarR family transcriptional regulator [Acidovorax sp. Root275]MBD9395074.1 winged helix-turn-helix transcriptional regulator [Acidovorax sp. ACV01]